MGVIPGSNRRLTARASIFVALPLVGVLLAGGALSLCAEIERENVPAGSAAATEISNPPCRPSKSELRQPNLASLGIEGTSSDQSTSSPPAVAPTQTTKAPKRRVRRRRRPPTAELRQPELAFLGIEGTLVGQAISSPPVAAATQATREDGSSLSDPCRLATPLTQALLIEDKGVHSAAVSSPASYRQLAERRVPPREPTESQRPELAFPGVPRSLTSQSTALAPAAHATWRKTKDGVSPSDQRKPACPSADKSVIE